MTLKPAANETPSCPAAGRYVMRPDYGQVICHGVDPSASP